MAQYKPSHPGAVALKTLGVALGAAASAQAQPAADNTTVLAPVTVQADSPAPYKADQVQSGKFVQPLLNTPQSITVVPHEVLEEQHAQSLQDVLRNVPGLSLIHI